MIRINSINRLQEDNLAFLLYKLLSKQGLKVCQSELKKMLNAHYAFPSPLSISDILDNLELEHEVFYLTDENITELENLPFPLLCYEKDKNEYSLIESIERDRNSYKLVNRREKIIEFHEELILITVFVDKGKIYGQIIEKCKTFKIQKVFFLVCFVLSFLLIFGFTYLGYNKSFFAFWISNFIISVLGILTSWILINIDVDSQNMSFLTRKVCINNHYFNCRTVSQSLRIPLLEKFGTSIAELGFLYFTIVLIYGLFYVGSNKFSLALPMAISNVCAIPIIIGLFIYQLVKIKKICMLCLATYLLITLQLMLFIRYGLFSMNIHWRDIVYFMLYCSVVLMVFFFLKLFSVHRSQYESAIIAHQRILNNPVLINKILQSSKKISYCIEDFDLIIGDKNASHKILVVPDMRCYSCAEILKSTSNLVKKHSNCVLIIRFFLFRDKLNVLDLSVIHVVLAIAQKSGTQEALIFLIGWLKTYPKDELEFERYTCKKLNNSINANIDHQISFYKQWSIENNFIRTPTLAINGQELPDLLNIENLKYYFI